MGVARPEALRWAWRRFKAPTSEHHPTGASPAVMKTASLSLAGCDCRPMGTSPIETKTAPRVFGYCVSKRRQELTELDSRDASKIRRGGRASGSRRAIRCHVCLSSDRTACAEPLLLSSLLDVWQAWDAILRVVLPRGSAMGVEGVQSAPPSEHHPTGASPAVMGTASLSLAGCDCRPMGTSPIETRIAPRVFGYRISKRARAWTGFISRDARASGLKRATPCHVSSTSNRAARAG